MGIEAVQEAVAVRLVAQVQLAVRKQREWLGWLEFSGPSSDTT